MSFRLAYVASLCFCFPAVAIVMYRFTMDYDLSALPLFGSLFVVEALVLLSGSQRHRRVVLEEMATWLSSYPNVHLQMRDVQEYGLTPDTIAALRRGFWAWPSGLNVQMYQVICETPPIPTLKAFSFGGHCVVFIPDSPEDIRGFGKFSLYHEVGHGYPTTPAFYALGYANLGSLALLCLIGGGGNHFALFSIVSMLAMQVVRSRFLNPTWTKQTVELSADQFAAYFLRNQVNLSDIARKLELLNRGDQDIEYRAERLRKFAEDPKENIRPDLPEIPFWVSIVAYVVINILGVGLDLSAVLPTIPILLVAALAMCGWVAWLVKNGNARWDDLTRQLFWWCLPFTLRNELGYQDKSAVPPSGADRSDGD